MTTEKKHKKRTIPMTSFVIIFLSGMLIAFLIALVFPLDTTLERVYYSGKSLATNILTGKAIEQPSPQDWIKEDQIEFHNDKVIIHVENPNWASFSDTNSMDPVLDRGTDAIEIVPENPSQIQIGDIVAYKSKIANAEIVHRVLKTGYDENGWYAILKGDNNPQQDPEKVRFNQIKKVVVALIY